MGPISARNVALSGAVVKETPATAETRARLEQLEESGFDPRSSELLVMLCWLVQTDVAIPEAELNATSDVLGIQVQNFTAAASQIQDANIADEVVNLTKYQILMQAGTSALSQANQSSQSVLALFR